MKAITIAGGLTRDAVLRTTQAGENVLGFSVAVDHRQGQETVPMYFDCSLWGKRGEALKTFLTKGKKVAVSGDLMPLREHNGKTYLTVRVSELTLMGGGERRDDAPAGYDQSPLAGGTRPNAGGGRGRADMDDDIPFNPELR